MPFIKTLALSVWESIIEDFTKLPKILLKSLFYCPFLYGSYWLVSHHAPPYALWGGYFFAALSFTSPPKKTNSRPNKEEPQRPSTPIILPASSWRKSNDHHA